jgi:hypothetical protein
MQQLSLPGCLTIAVAALSAAPASASDKNQYSLFNPTPDAQLRSMSTDRPDKTESPYTVDAGRFQIETGLVAFTRDSRNGLTTRSFDLMPFNLKIGLTHDADLQVAYGAFNHSRTSGNRISDEQDGFGDVTLRLKHNVWGNDSGKTAFALMPFLKVPANTLASLNNDIEGGLIAPLAVDLGHGLGLGLMTEIDILKSDDGKGYEPVFINSATMSFELTERLGIYVEAYLERGTGGGAETIVTLDSGFTYAITDDLQLDAGANVGVTKAADDLNIFAGLSRRF